jgi:hypothetical protein
METIAGLGYRRKAWTANRVVREERAQWWGSAVCERPYTTVNSTEWSSPTHLGSQYAALLVDSSYVPPAKSDSLPMPGNGVVTVAIAPGGDESEPVPATLYFSGYDWDIPGIQRDNDRKGAWTDSNGWLHPSS